MNRLLACRVCLAYNTRLCSIVDGQLREIYEKLVEASLDTEDMLPTSVCYICYSVMKKMLQFRDRSQKANQILQQIISSGLEPSISSLDILVKDQTGISWTLGISNIERTTTTSGEVELEVKLESVEAEVDIDRMSDRYEDYSDSMPVYRHSKSDSEDDLPLQNISEQCKTECVNVKIENTHNVRLKNSSGREGGVRISDIVRTTTTSGEDEFVVKIESVEAEMDIDRMSDRNEDYLDSMPVYKDATSDSEDDLPLQNISKCRIYKTDRANVKIENTHNVRLKKSSGREDKRKYEFFCPQCPKTFSQKCNLITHIKKHSGIKDHICEECGAAYYSQKNLVR